MNIPKRNGHYEIKTGSNTIVVDIETVGVRMSKLDKIEAGDRSRIGGYKYVPKYNVKVLDANGNVIDSLPDYNSYDENEYVNFISSFIGKEVGASVSPDKLRQDLVFKFQQDTGMYVMDSKFNGIVKNKIKFTFYVDDWHPDRGGRYDPSEISAYFEKLGAVCKIAEKKKNVRAGQCWVASVYLPVDFRLDESKKASKRLIRLTENDLHRIVKEVVNQMISERREGDHEFVKGNDGYSQYYINHGNKSVSAIHGYPGAGKKYAKKHGYKYHDIK